MKICQRGALDWALICSLISQPLIKCMHAWRVLCALASRANLTVWMDGGTVRFLVASTVCAVHLFMPL